MSPLYRRTIPGPRENLGAGLISAGLALGVAAASFYVVRIFLAREPFEPRPPAAGTKEGEEGKSEARVPGVHRGKGEA